MEQLGPLPEDEAEVDAGRDLADLVPDPLRDNRRVRVVEDDRLLLVEPARLLVDLGANRLDAERADLVQQLALPAVEHLSLPADQVDEPRDRPDELGAGRQQHGAVRLAVGDLAGGASPEELVELVRRHRLELGSVDRHPSLRSGPTLARSFGG